MSKLIWQSIKLNKTTMNEQKYKLLKQKISILVTKASVCTYLIK